MSSFIIGRETASVSTKVALLFMLFSTEVLKFEHSIKSLPLVSLFSRGMHFTFIYRITDYYKGKASR